MQRNPFLREKLRAVFGLSDQERAALGEHAKTLDADMKRLVRFASPEIGRDSARQRALELRCNQFAVEACKQARRLVDAYLSGERDENYHAPKKPTVNSVAEATYRALYKKKLVRSEANKLCRASMTPDRLARLGLSNPLDELSAHTPRTKRR